METKAERIAKAERLYEAIEKAKVSLILEQAKEWLKGFIGEPWYDAAVKAYVDIVSACGRVLHDMKRLVLKAIGREDLYNDLTDVGAGTAAGQTTAATMGAAAAGKTAGTSAAQAITYYKTWEYLDERYNHVVVDDVRDELVELQKQFRQQLEEVYAREMAGKLIPEAGKEMYQSLDMDFDFNKFDTATRDYLRDKKIRWSKQVADETEREIKAQLVRGYEAGLSSYKIADNIKQSTGFSVHRAEAIARTEVLSACEYASYQAALADDNIVGHYWRAQNSRRTRSTHRAANGQYRPKGVPFDVGGAQLLFPGDSSLGAPAKEVINCRCWLKTVFAGEEIEVSVAERKAERNAFTVDTKKINTKAYTDKYQSVGYNRKVDVRVKNEAVSMLKHRSGTELEDLVFLDAKTGKNVVKRVDSAIPRGVKLNRDDIDQIKSYDGKLISIHNHPGSTRPSLSDLTLMAQDDKIEKLIVAGHDGSVHIISNLNRSVDLRKVYREYYEDFLGLHQNKQIADLLAMDKIYSSNLFKYEMR